MYLSRQTVELMSLLTFDTSFSSASAKKKPLLITPLSCSVWHFWLLRELPHLNAAAAAAAPCIAGCTKRAQTFMSTLLMRQRLYRLGDSALLWPF